MDFYDFDFSDNLLDPLDFSLDELITIHTALLNAIGNCEDVLNKKVYPKEAIDHATSAIKRYKALEVKVNKYLGDTGLLTSSKN